jgi:hypothetical protein
LLLAASCAPTQQSCLSQQAEQYDIYPFSFEPHELGPQAFEPEFDAFEQFPGGPVACVALGRYPVQAPAFKKVAYDGAYGFTAETLSLKRHGDRESDLSLHHVGVKVDADVTDQMLARLGFDRVSEPARFHWVPIGEPAYAGERSIE